MYNHFECLDSSLSLIMCIIFKGHRKEEDVEDEGVLDPSQELIEEAELLMIGDNEKARLFKGFLARQFFRGMVSVSLKQYTILQSPLRNVIKNLNSKFSYFLQFFPCLQILDSPRQVQLCYSGIYVPGQQYSLKCESYQYQSLDGGLFLTK